MHMDCAYDGKTYTRQIQLDHPMCDLSGRLSMHQLFLQMQETAGDDSGRLGFGTEFVEREGIFWVLSRAVVTIERMPRLTERVILRTWHLPTIRYIFPRNFTMEDESGSCIGQASTLWMLIDRQKREIVLPSLRGYVMPDTPVDMPKIASPGKLLFPFEPDKEAMRSPVYSDFDVNGHMNNARYPLWICDLFPPAMHAERHVGAMQINYVREIVYGEDVAIAYGERNGQFVVRGEVKGETRFEAAGHFGA